MIAARKFEPERGWTFKTYAMNWTESKMQRLMMQAKRQTGWVWNPNKAEQREGKKGMQKLAQISQMPVGEDGHELEITSHSYREDFVTAIDLEQRKARVLSLTRNGRERTIMERLLNGDDYRQIGEGLGISWQRVHQIAKPMLKRIQSEIAGGPQIEVSQAR